MTINEIRKDFPILNKPNAPIYFDNACMTLRPQQVIDALTHYYADLSSCGGRSNHTLAQAVSKEVDNTRELTRSFINAANKDEIIFTRNTTEGLNIVARGLNFAKGDIVLVSQKEHNSNLIPWLRLAEEKGIIVKTIPLNEDNTLNMEALATLLSETTQIKMVSIVGTSNLDGVSNPIAEVITLAHKYAVPVMIDAAQYICHFQIDVQKLDVDFLAFSGHKLLGPSGTGVLYGKKQLLDGLNPYTLGGSTVAESTYDSYELLPVPARFEAGLQDYGGIMGLGAALAYIKNVGYEFITVQELLLNSHISKAFADDSRLTLIGPADPAQRSGIFSFYVPKVDVHQIALMLNDTAKIAVRSGQHCVHSWFHAHEIRGSVRASVTLYNTIEEAETFVKTLKNILDVLT